MRANFTGLMALLVLSSPLLTGCPHGPGDSGDSDTHTGETGDTGNDTSTADKTVLLNYTFNSDIVDSPCDVNVDDKFAGKTGEDIWTTPGPHTVTFGKLANHTADDPPLPIHTDSSGDWVHPAVEIDKPDGGEVIDEIQGNRLISGMWTCTNRDVDEDFCKAEIVYTGGEHLTLPCVGTANVSDEQISSTFANWEITGEISSTTSATASLRDTEIDFTSVYDCESTPN